MHQLHGTVFRSDEEFAPIAPILWPSDSIFYGCRMIANHFRGCTIIKRGMNSNLMRSWFQGRPTWLEGEMTLELTVPPSPKCCGQTCKASLVCAESPLMTLR